MNDLFQRLSTLDPAMRDRLIDTATIIAALWVIRWTILRVAVRRIEKPELRFKIRKGISYAVVITGVLLVGRTWSGGMSQLGAFLGLVTAGLAIALNQPLTNLAGWLFILWRRPFRIGDRVEVGNHAGDVTDLRLFQFTILEIGNWVDADQYTGRVIHLPNALVFNQAQANFHTSFQLIWNELPVMVTFESDWRGAKTILQGIVAEHTRTAGDLGDWIAVTHSPGAGPHAAARLNGTAGVLTSVADSGVVLTLRYLCRPDERRGTAEVIWEEILTAFAARDDIDFAYPTTRYYDNVSEGKPQARAEPG